MWDSRLQHAVEPAPVGDGWVHVGCYADANGLRRSLERIRRLWADRYVFRVVAPDEEIDSYRLYVRHRHAD